MGFYGKVTNSSKTQFSFDRIYANRKEMDELCASDGVFVGRYVLIDYDEGNASFKRIYVKELDNGKKVAWATPNFDEAIGELKKGNFRENEIVYEAQLLDGNVTQVIKKYYTVKFVGDSYELVDTKEPTESMESNYVTNFNIDKDYISEKANHDTRAFGRGYDSTVWTKVFEKGQYKYVSVAELNSVVPTFDVTADAPTLSPLTPHFDADSTNVYYKLHTQPSWGFRVKKATPELIYDIDPITGEIGGDPISPEDSDLAEKMIEYDDNGVPIFYRLNSDQTTVWKRKEYDKYPKEKKENKDSHIHDYYYDPHTDKWKEYDPTLLDKEKKDEADRNGQVSADIYYNKDGFNKDYIYKSNLKDEITITPTGASGHIYAHDKKKDIDSTEKPEKTKDIQELSIHLASIGNTISDMWDMVYGDASANRHHEGIWYDNNGERTWKNEEPAIKWVPQEINLTKRELDYYKTLTELIGNKGRLKWVDKELVNEGFEPAPTDKLGVHESGVYDVGRNITWSENKKFYIFNKVPVRNTDIKWRDGLDTINSEPDYESYVGYEDYPPTQSMRLVHSDNDKTIGKEYTYNKDQVSTIAGTINAAHDLMGMIIHEVTDGENITDNYIDNSEENLIYYYSKYKGNTKIKNPILYRGRDENGIPNRGITLKKAITKDSFEYVNVSSAEDFRAGEMYLRDDNNPDKYYLATKYEENKTYYKLNTVDLLEFKEANINSADQFIDGEMYLHDDDQDKYYLATKYEDNKTYYKLKTTSLQDRQIEPGQFYRKKVDYVYEEVPQAQYWNKNNVDSVLWERAGADGKLIQFNKKRLFTRESKSYSDSNGELKSFYRYIPTNDDKALPDKSYYKLIADDDKTNILESTEVKDLNFYTKYNPNDSGNSENSEGYWTIKKYKVNDGYKEEENKNKKKIYSKEIAETITQVEKKSEKNFYKFTPKAFVDKELYIPGAYFLKLRRRAINPKKKDKYYAVSTARFVPKTGGNKHISLDQLAKLSYSIDDDNEILSILFRENESYYTHDNNYENIYTNLGLFPVNWSDPNEDRIDLGDGIQEYKTDYVNDRFEAKWANDFDDPDDHNNKYYLVTDDDFDEVKYGRFEKNNFDIIVDNATKLNEVLQRIKEVQIIDKDGVESKIIKTIPESLIDIYIKEDITAKEDAQKLLNELSTEKYFFNDPGEYIFKFKELTRQEDEKFNALNLKKISGLQKVSNDGGENSAVQYKDILEEDLKKVLGLTLKQLLDGIEPNNALYSHLGQQMSAINKRIDAIIDLYDNGKNSNEINKYEFDFNNPNLYYLDSSLFDKSIAEKKYYAKRLKYVNLPKKDTENFYNSMAEKGNLFILNVPKDLKNLIKPIEHSKYVANAFFVCRTKNFENPLDTTEPLSKDYWNLANKSKPTLDESYYDLSDYLIPVKVDDKIDNKKDYYIKTMMPATEKFASYDVDYYKIKKIEGNYDVIPADDNKNDDAILSKLSDEGITNYYPNPKYFDKVFVTADIGTPLTMYKPGEYYRRITTGEHVGEYELDITENGQSSIYAGSGYYDWPQDESKDKDCLKTADQFFIPDVYYYKEDKVYWLASEEFFNNNKDAIYYKGKTYYVIKDDLGHYATGAEWNPAIVPVPMSVHLGIRKEKYKWEKLKDFSRTYNTLNGLILRTNKLLEDGDIYTRDTSTIQGCINRIRDIIAKFEATKPGNLMIVDGYGRVRGTDYVTKQPDIIKNYGFNSNGEEIGKWITPKEIDELNYKDEENNELHGRWIDLQVLTYNFLGKGYNTWEAAYNVAKSMYDSNKLKFGEMEVGTTEKKYYYFYTVGKITNDEYIRSYNKLYIKTNNSDEPFVAINKIPTHKFDANLDYWYALEREDNVAKNKIDWSDENSDGLDELWHMVITNESEIKIAHNFINNNVANLDLDSHTESDKNRVLTSDDELLKYNKNDNSDEEENYRLGINNHTGDTIELYTPIVDEMGHVVGKNRETLTLPYEFKTINTANSNETGEWSQSDENTKSIVADSINDELTIDAGNKWIRFTTNSADGKPTDSKSQKNIENKLTIAHETHWDAANDATDKDTLEGFTRDAKISRTSTTLNGVETFTTEHYTFDNAGHVNSHNTHTYELPHNYGEISLLGISNKSDFNAGKYGDTGTFLTEGKPERRVALKADKSISTLKINSGNKWITIQGIDTNGDNVNDSLTFSHAPAGTAIDTKGNSDNISLDYGSTFITLQLGIDEAGHVKTLTDHTITMPKQNIIGEGNVVTKADHDTGNTLTFKHEQLMNLKLSTNSDDTIAVTTCTNPDRHTSHTAITGTDTLRKAFGKIPTMIDERVEDILGAATPDTLDTLTEISAWINANGADLNKYVNLVTLEKDFYGLDSNGNVLSYNGTNSLMNRTSTLETSKNNIYTMLGDVDHYALNGHYSLDHSAERDPNKVYYTFSNGQYVEILLTDSMYEPSKYYIKDVTVEDRIKGLESQVDHYVTDDLKQKVDAAWDLLQTVQQTTGNVPADPDTMTPTASVDGYMKYHVGRTAPTDTEGNPITNAMWIDTSNMQNILVKFPVYNYNAETGKNVLSWISINTWQ